MKQRISLSEKVVKEKLRIAAILAVNAGFIDAYTFFQFDGRFAGAQTGNLVQAGIAVAQGDWNLLGGFMIPIVFFLAGVWLREIVSHIREKYHRDHTIYLLWVQMFLHLIFVTSYIIFPKLPGTLCIGILSFIMAIQMNNFSVTRGLAYGSIFSTANMRSFAQNLAQYVFTRDKEKLGNASVYFTLIASFFAGSALSTLLQHFMAAWTLYGSAVFLLLVLYIFSLELKDMEKQLK